MVAEEVLQIVTILIQLPRSKKVISRYLIKLSGAGAGAGSGAGAYFWISGSVQPEPERAEKNIFGSATLPTPTPMYSCVCWKGRHRYPTNSKYKLFSDITWSGPK
jgi:hypothetical protein